MFISNAIENLVSYESLNILDVCVSVRDVLQFILQNHSVSAQKR